MKVLLISHYPPPSGGIASWTKRLLEIGLPNGWEIVHVNSNMIRGRDSYKNTKMSLRDELARCFGIWGNGWKILKTDKEREIKVVHTCIPCKTLGMFREIITGIIAKIRGRKFILHCRCTVPNVVSSPGKRLVFKILAFLCDGIMVLNQKSYYFIKQVCGEKKIVGLIPNFVTENELCSVDERTYSDSVHDVVYDGGVIADKGCDLIIEAAADLPDIIFHLIGNASEEMKNAKMPENVVLYGNRDKAFIKEMLLKCDAFLFLTRFWGEGFSNSLVEAMSAGLPCIVTDWAANADMIGNDGGIVLEEGTAQALKEAIGEIAGKDTRMAMGKRNIEKVKIEYIESAIVPQYVEFYEKLLTITDMGQEGNT